MEVVAKLQHYRQSPRKVRLVANYIRGLQPDQALDELRFVNKRVASVLSKLVKAAMNDAEHNFSIAKDNLLIKTITVDSGPTLKRWRARAFGRAASIRKRTSHICVVLEEKVKQVANKGDASAEEKKDALKNVSDIKAIKKLDELKKTRGKQDGEPAELGSPSSKSANVQRKGFAPKLIQRKAG
jgi:large subunit ribosomal protein L22